MPIRPLRSAFASAVVAVGVAGPANAEQLGTFGTPGLIDMPTAGVLDDGIIALSYAVVGTSQRATATFQITPRLYGTLRYSTVDGVDAVDASRNDHGFDLHYQFWDEATYRPAISVGLRDIGGTGLYSSEYVVATKTFGRLSGTVGLGRGAFGGTRRIFEPVIFLVRQSCRAPRRLWWAIGRF